MGLKLVKKSITEQLLEKHGSSSGKVFAIVNTNDPGDQRVITISPGEQFELYIIDNGVVQKIGDVDKNIGSKLIHHIAADITANAEAAKRIRLEKARRARVERYKKIDADNIEFEKTVPEGYMKLFKRILRQIKADNVSYRQELYSKVITEIGGYPNPEVWSMVLPWYEEKVLNCGDCKEFFKLRKALATTVIKAQQRLKNGTLHLLEGATEENENFWDEYANEISEKSS